MWDWAGLVQPFWHVLDTHTNKQAKYVYVTLYVYTAHCTMYMVVNNKNYSKEKYIIPIPWYISNISNRLSSTIGGNREID